MRVYVAAKFEHAPTVRVVNRYLALAGHEVSHDWTHATAGCDLQLHAEAELEGVRTADAVLVVPHPQGKGLFAELGAALALGKRVLLAGAPAGCIFEDHPAVEKFGTLADALRALGCRL